MWNACHKFVRLPAESKRFVLRTILILPMSYAGLELFGLNRLLARIQRRAPNARQMPEPSLQEIQAYTHLFSAVARRCPLPLQCLGRSVALCWLLRQQGIDATVHIGVRKENNALDAHAWVQSGDFVINDAENVAERYTRVLPSYSEIDTAR
jgi:hypothetical protein